MIDKLAPECRRRLKFIVGSTNLKVGQEQDGIEERQEIDSIANSITQETQRGGPVVESVVFELHAAILTSHVTSRDGQYAVEQEWEPFQVPGLYSKGIRAAVGAERNNTEFGII